MTEFIEKGDAFVIESTQEEVAEGSQEQSGGLGVLGGLGGVSGRTRPVVVLVIGMAGSGKTTLMHRINHHMKESGKNGYYINLDPGELRQWWKALFSSHYCSPVLLQLLLILPAVTSNCFTLSHSLSVTNTFFLTFPHSCQACSLRCQH